MKRRGLSFIEVLVASTIMVVTLVPLFLVFSQGVRTGQVSIDEIRANLLAQEIVDQIAVMPYAGGWPAIQDRPRPNAPPGFTRWADLPATGLDLPNPVGATPVEISTGGWTRIGYPYPMEEAPDVIAPFQRLYLTGLDSTTTRSVKVHPAMAILHQNVTDPDIAEIEGRIVWKTRGLTGTTPERSVIVRTLISNPAVSAGGP